MKKILVFILVTVLLAMLCSCSPQELSPDTSAETQYTFGEDYEVYVASLFETEGCLTGFTKIDSCLSHAEPPEPSKKTQTLRIDETDHVLNYVSTHDRSWNNHVYEYANAKDTVNCLYWSDTMQLARVTLDDLPLEKFAHMDQTQYDQWIHTFVAQFSDEDWDTLHPSCRTYYTESGENYSSGCNADGFKTDFAENEHLKSYDFQYVRYIDSVATSDKISTIVHFDFENSTARVTIWLNEHAFDPYTTIALDIETIKSVVNKFVDAHINSNCTKKQVILNWGNLTQIDGNLMYYCSITVEWSENSITKKECPYNLLINIPDR